MCKHGRSVFRKSADNIWFKVDYYLAERNFIEEVKRQTCKCGLKVPAQVELHGIKVTLSLVPVKGHFTIMINGKVVSPQVWEVSNKSFIIPCSYVSKLRFNSKAIFIVFDRYLSLLRSSQERCSIKKAVIKYFAILTEKSLCWSLFVKKLQAVTPTAFLRKDSTTQVFLSLWILWNF